MPHIQVLIDGETRYEGDVPDTVIPSRPELFPTALGQGLPANTPAPPLAKLTMLTGVIEVLRRALTSPMLNARVDVTPRAMGCITITVDMPIPTQETG